jgi:transposase-like protein
MPWEEVSMMSQRREFVELSHREEANLGELCRRIGVSPTTGNKWRKRYRVGGEAALADLPGGRHHSPGRTEPRI